VQEARIYTRPDQAVPIYVCDDRRARCRGCTGLPRSRRGDKPVQAGMLVSWGADAGAALDVAHRLWANDILPGQLAQILPRPQDY
jgi:hypothetical protein